MWDPNASSRNILVESGLRRVWQIFLTMVELKIQTNRNSFHLLSLQAYVVKNYGFSIIELLKMQVSNKPGGLAYK